MDSILIYVMNWFHTNVNINFIPFYDLPENDITYLDPIDRNLRILHVNGKSQKLHGIYDIVNENNIWYVHNYIWLVLLWINQYMYVSLLYYVDTIQEIFKVVNLL